MQALEIEETENEEDEREFLLGEPKINNEQIPIRSSASKFFPQTNCAILRCACVAMGGVSVLAAAVLYLFPTVNTYTVVLPEGPCESITNASFGPPCNVIGASNLSRPFVLEKNQQRSWRTVHVHLEGRFGNNLFQFAASISTALELHKSLNYEPYNPILPHLREIMVDENHITTLSFLTDIHPEGNVLWGPGGIQFYQNAFWVDTFARHRVDLCYYLAMPEQYQERPSPTDIVIHIRLVQWSSILHL